MLALAVALFAVAHTWNFSTKCFGRDFYQFWVVSREIGRPDLGNIYSEQWRRETGERYWRLGHEPRASVHQIVASDETRVLDPTATPLLYTCFRIFPDDYARALLVQEIVLFAGGIIAIILLCGVLDFSLTATLLSVAALFGWGEAYLSDVFCANVNQIQLLSVAILLWLELRPAHAARDYLCGALLGFMVMFKPNLGGVALLMAVMWLTDRQTDKLKRHAIAFAISAVMIVIATSIEFGSARCWLWWLGALRQLEWLCRLRGAGTYSLNSVLAMDAPWWIARGSCWMFLPLALLAIYVTGGTTNREQPHRTILVIALGCALPILTTTIVWLHYYVLAVPLLVALLRPPTDGAGMSPPGRYIVAAILLPMLCASQVTSQWLWLSDPVSVTRRMAGVTAALFLLGLFDLWRISKPAGGALSSQATGEHAHVTKEIR